MRDLLISGFVFMSVVSLSVSNVFSATVDGECLRWFIRSKIDPTKNCLEVCGTTTVGMGTFQCLSQCEKLCALQLENQKIKDPQVYYPGLSFEEIKLVAQYPKKVFVVLKQKQVAEVETKKVFGRNIANDESDAFRHFMWAGLLVKELGPDLAKKFLDAHEAGESRESPSRAMDLANNREALLVAEKLQKTGRLNQEALKKEAHRALQDGSLVVLSPRGGPK